MATLHQAEAARRAHADTLARAGAHAVGVESGAQFNQDDYVVVVYAEPGKKLDLPETIAAGGAKTQVPVVVQRAEKFKPESL